MSGRLRLIEQKLLAIDSAGFQSLCDAYLFLHFGKKVESINRAGSQLGKQKTIKGTPDSFIRLSNNNLVFIEFTTKTDNIVSKIKGDIDKCLTNNTDISKIIICHNSRLSVENETEIQTYALNKNRKVQIIGIDTIALAILLKYPSLSRDFLNIPIDTGQILDFDKFISEYNNKAHQLSTPLDNVFLHRNNELEEINNCLETKDLIIISGAAGIGKTKIGLESINHFIAKNVNYKALVIAKKDVDIYEDLRVQLQLDKDYILLIDDANRQLPNLEQILGIFKEKRNNILKIVITVRNYALSELKKSCYGYDFNTIEIEKLKDEEITDILKSDSFKILNPDYQKKIVSLADGNARLAIMSARLANETQQVFLHGDAVGLYDSYFHSFIKDFDLFENKNLLKTLGITSFFFTIDINHCDLINQLLTLFNINRDDFFESIDELHKRELIEVCDNYVRVSEQVMATYIFYKVFIQNELLSFETLLFNFFENSKYHFKDSIIAASNSFGYDNVLSKITSSIDTYLQNIKGDDTKILNFLDLFWIYKRDFTLSYFYAKISHLSEPINPIYLTHYETNDFVHQKEKTIDFISRFYLYSIEELKPAIELGFEYIRKKPEHLPEFIRRIRENLTFDREDAHNNFWRQITLIDVIISNVSKNKEHYTIAFFAIAKTFLQHSFHKTHGGRNHSFTMYNYPLPFCEPIKNIRTKIWQILFENYKKYSDEVFDIVKHFKPTHHQLISELMDFDLDLLVPFIKDNFTSKNFKYTYFVQDMIYWYDREKKIRNREYKKLKRIFLTREYLEFCKFDWKHLGDKNQYQLGYIEHTKFELLKTKELKKHFLFSDKKQFKKLFNLIDNKLSIDENEKLQIGFSLDIIVLENYKQKPELGFELLKRLAKRYSNLQVLNKSLKCIIETSEEYALQIWKFLEKWQKESGQSWQMQFFYFLPDRFIDKFYTKKLLKTISGINQFANLYIENLSRYKVVDLEIIVKIIQIVLAKNSTNTFNIRLSDHIFEHLEYFNNDYELIKSTYFSQNKFNHTDYNRKGFESIFNLNKQFLIDYIQAFYYSTDFSNRDTHLKIPFIWNSQENFNIIEQACDFIIEKNPYFGIGDHSLQVIFNDIKEIQIENTVLFLKKYIEKHKNNTRSLRIIFHTIRHCPNISFDDFFSYFITINTDIEIFKNIDWVGNVGVVSGNVIFGELYEKKWSHIMDLVNDNEDTLTMIPIKAFLKEKIATCIRDAENERKQKFLQRY